MPSLIVFSMRWHPALGKVAQNLLSFSTEPIFKCQLKKFHKQFWLSRSVVRCETKYPVENSISENLTNMLFLKKNRLIAFVRSMFYRRVEKKQRMSIPHYYTVFVCATSLSIGKSFAAFTIANESGVRNSCKASSIRWLCYVSYSGVKRVVSRILTAS